MNKYHAKKTIVDGIEFDSKKEAKRYEYLKRLEDEDKIYGLMHQVSYELIPSQYIDGKCIERPVRYVADFHYFTDDGSLVVEDVKGMKQRRPEYIIKRKLMLKEYGIRISEV